MSDDRRPSITRTRANSLFPRSRETASPIGGRRPYSSSSATPYDPDPDRSLGDRLIDLGLVDPFGIGEEPIPEREEPREPGPVYYSSPFLQEVALRQKLGEDSTTTIGLPDGYDPDKNASIFAPLGDVDPNTLFLFDRGAVTNPETGEKTGVMESRGIYASADVLDDRLTPGTTTQVGDNENYMTLSAGILWLRNLAARDRTAYNDLVVALRNAGYGTLPDDDRLLPLNGYTQQVGVAFALAANDLAAANQGGDDRTLLEYLTDRGQGYEDYIAQKEADEAYQPVDRRYQDPATLRAAAKEAAISALGRKLTDEEEARFEASFRAKENALYDAIDQAGENETSFSGYAPDVTGQVDAFLDGPEFETEHAANLIGQYAQVFGRMVGLG